ncbi:TIGR02266 family protein [Myxococcota bacterium]
MTHPSDRTPRNRGLKLESVTQLERELGSRRDNLVRLQAERDSEKERLQQARAKHSQLEKEIRELDKSIGIKNQTIFVLFDEVEYLLRVHKRVQNRAQELARKAKDQTAPEQERQFARHALVVEVGLKTDTNFYVGFSENVSEGGLFVATYDTRPQGERFMIEFTLPNHHKPIQCMVEVAWVNEHVDDNARDSNSSLPGMGLRFVGLEAEDREAIATFIETREPLFFPEFDSLS